MRAFLGVAGILIALVGITFVGFAIGDLVSPDPEDDTGVGVLVFLLVFFAGVTAMGVGMARKNLATRSDGLSLEARERHVLQLASTRGGRLTVAEVAAHTPLGLAEARATLEHLERHGAADLQLTPEGAMVYTFRLVSAAEKAEAVDVLEA